MAIRLRQQNQAGVLLSLVAVLALLAVACQGSSVEPSLEEQAQALDKQLMCPVCPSETIDQSRVELAKQMRAIVRERLADGESEQEIKDFFVDRYGDNVLAAPPARGFNIVVWVIAGLALPMAAAILVLALRVMRRRVEAVPAPAQPKVNTKKMETYLSKVDEEMSETLGR